MSVIEINTIPAIYGIILFKGCTGESLMVINEINIFHVAFVGNGAPFRKDNTACSWLVSFLNRDMHILSNMQ